MHGNRLLVREDSVANAANLCIALHSPSFGGGPEFSHHRARENAHCCVFAKREIYVSSAMSTGWYNHATQGNRESSRKRTAHSCAHCRPESLEARSDRPSSSANCQKPYGNLPNTSKNKIRTATHSDCVMLQVCSARHSWPMRGFAPAVADDVLM